MRCSINNIPEDILITIISLLDLKEAVKTSILSRRWQHLWKNIPNLDLHPDNVLSDVETNKILSDFNSDGDFGLTRETAREFIINVDRILGSHRGVGVDRLSISVMFDERDHALHLDRWVSFAVTSRAKMLHFDVGSCVDHDPSLPQVYYNFPHHFFSSVQGLRDHSTPPPLEKLILYRCSLRSNDGQNFDGFKNLRTLRLRDVEITDQVIQNLLSVSASLRVLEFRTCPSLIHLQIPNTLCVLEALEVHSCYNLKKLECFAPNLSSLLYDGKQIPLAFKTGNSLLLEEARMTLDSHSMISVMDQLHREMPRLKTLELCVHIKPKVLDLMESHIRFIHLKFLRLTISQKCVGCVTFLLVMAPFLEEFCVQVWRPQIARPSRQLRTPHKCQHTYLKKFKIIGFRGSRHEVGLLKFVLANATQLEAMTVIYGPFSSASRRKFARKFFAKRILNLVPKHLKLVIELHHFR